MHRRSLLCALPAALVLGLGLAVLAGCDGSGSGPGSAAPPGPGSRPAQSSSPVGHAAGAADGRDLRACADADCEVEVRAGDVIHFDDRVARRAGADTFRITGVQDDGFSYRMTSSDGSVVGSGSQSGAGVWGATNGVGMHLVSGGPGGVVIQLRAGG